MDATTVFLWITMMLITLAMGLGLRPSDFRRVLSTRRAVLVGVTGQLLLLPMVGFAVAWVFALPPALAVGLVLIAACPGGTHSNLFAGLARADVALSITLTAVSGLATILTIPLWVGLATRVFQGADALVTLDVGRTMLSLLLIVALPTAIGVGIRTRSDRVADVLGSLATALGIALLLVIVIGAVSANGALVAEHARRVGLPVLVLNTSTMALGGLSARAAGLPRAQQITVALEVGVQNSALGYGLASTLLHGLDYAIPGIVYSLLVYGTGTALVAWSRWGAPADT